MNLAELKINRLGRQLLDTTQQINILNTKNNLIQSHGEIRFKFSDDKNYVVSGTYAKDTDIKKISDSSIKLMSGTTTTNVIFRTMNMAFASDDVLGVWVYIKKEDIKNLKNITFTLSNWEDPTYILNVTSIMFVKYGYYGDTSYDMTGGWNFLKFKKSDADSSVTPTDIRTVFNCMKITITGRSNSNPISVWFDSIVFNNRLKPTILLSFDDSVSTMYTTTYPLLKTYGFSATFSVNWLFGEGNVTPIQMREMMRNGWDYSTRLVPSLTGNTLKDEYKISLTNLANNGFSTPTMFSCPLNYCSEEMFNIIPTLGFKLIRQLGNSYTTYIDSDTLEIGMVAINNVSGTLANVEKNIDNAIERGNAICIMTHRITDTDDSSTNGSLNTSKSVYTQLLDYIKSKVDLGLAQVITPKYFYEQAFLPSTKVGNLTIPSNYNKNIAVIPSTVANTFGTTVLLKAPENTNYFGVHPTAIDVVFSGTFVTETVTSKVILTYSNGTTNTITKTSSSPGTISFANTDIMSVVKDNVYIVQATFSSSSNIVNSTTIVTFKICGVYI